MPKYTYNVEVLTPDGTWWPVVKEEQKGFCIGYAWGHRETPSPRLSIRVTRSDGKVLEEFPGNEKVSLGMLAGMPTPEMYEAAAAEALKKAEEIRQCRRRYPLTEED